MDDGGSVVNEHDRLVDRAAREARTVVFVGGLDAGKSTLARATAAYALRRGRTVAYLDADVAQKTVGPPATVGLKHIREPDDLTLERLSHADALGFVGSTSPRTTCCRWWARSPGCATARASEGSDLVVVDTSGMVSGIWGQLVKYYKVDLLEPDLVVGLQRGGELDPILGVIERFFGVDAGLAAHPSGRGAHQRRAAFGAARTRHGLLLPGRSAAVPRQAHGVHAHAARTVRSARARPAAGGALRRRREGSPGSATSSSWPRTAGCA